MEKNTLFIFTIILIFFSGNLIAQKKSKINVERTDVQRYDAKLGKNKERLIGGVVFRQEGTRFYCDSAHLNRKKNNFEAFGNVHIIVNDTLDIYGERMFYEGDTKIAELFDSVRLIDKNTVLTTEHLVYNRDTRIAYYDVGVSPLISSNGLATDYLLEGYTCWRSPTSGTYSGQTYIITF